MKTVMFVLAFVLSGMVAKEAKAETVIGMRPVPMMGMGGGFGYGGGMMPSPCGISRCGMSTMPVYGGGSHGYAMPYGGYGYGYGYGYVRPRCGHAGGCRSRCGRRRCGRRGGFALAIGFRGFSFGLRIF